MTPNEFNQWLTHHSARFLGLPIYLAKNTDREGTPRKQDVLRAWAGVLSDLTLDEATRASNELYALPLEQLPKGFDRHPVAVRKIALDKRRSQGTRGPRRKVVDGIETFDCLFCRDTGVVIIVDPKTVNSIISGDGPLMVQDCCRHSFYTAVVGCTCKHSIRRQWNGMLYDEYRFCATSDDWGRLELDAMVAYVERWLKTRRPPNYVECFDQ